MDTWTRHMRRGDSGRAWELCDAALADRTLRDPRRPRHLQSVWDGSPVAGRRVLVLGALLTGSRRHDPVHPLRRASEGGRIRGDRLGSAGAASAPARRARHRPPAAAHDGVPECAYDVDVEIMEPAHVFRSAPETLPSDVPYLDAPAAPLEASGLRVGLAWRAGEWDSRRDLPFELAASIARVPVSAWSLQKDPREGEAGGLVRGGVREDARPETRGRRQRISFG